MPLGVARAVVTRASSQSVVATPQILGTVTTDFNSTDPHTSDSTTHTVTFGTEVLLLLVFYGRENALTPTTPTSSVNGAFSVISAPPVSAGEGFPTVGVYAIAAPTSGAHTITWGAATGMHYSGVILINLDDTDAADRFGDIENVAQGTDSNTIASSLTTEKANSLIVSWAGWQGADGAPITEDQGTQLAEFTTGASTSLDGAISVATDVGPSIPGSAPFGFTASTTDDFAYGAVEIRGA